MKKQRILIDLSILKNIHRGLGQVALNYGRYFAQHYTGSEAYELYLLLPSKMKGTFGNQVRYIGINWFNRLMLCHIPRMDVWHAIHQQSYFRSIYPSTKYLLTIHDLNFIYEKTPKKVARYMRRLQKKINRADKITCISEFVKQDIEKHMQLHGKTVEVIYNGVERLDAAQEMRPDFVKDTTPFFFTIGQVRKKKNFHVLLPLMRYYPDRQLYIAGQKNTAYADYINHSINDMQLPNVHLVGEVTNAERIWLYNHCEAFLFPSLFEGFGLPVVEAMLFGKAVFSSKETSLTEIGSDRAFFWNDFNPENMRDTINRHLPAFLQDTTEAQKNRAYARSFSYEKHLTRYLELYQTLLHR
ncbi:MAG: glycosyltransferase family 4 protein [Prevotellaceae bacterium]|jgi:glycosyltransferase involved in cell wall biosynthesis|nr:glycosyltransferase family 4 protein [Prevotellaceae bacterium]